MKTALDEQFVGDEKAVAMAVSGSCMDNQQYGGKDRNIKFLCDQKAKYSAKKKTPTQRTGLAWQPEGALCSEVCK
jgi:hypothetical protein